MGDTVAFLRFSYYYRKCMYVLKICNNLMRKEATKKSFLEQKKISAALDKVLICM